MNIKHVLDRRLNLFGTATSYEEKLAGGVKATGSILFDANPTADDTITLGDKTLTFKAAADAEEDEVTIGVDLDTTIDSIVTKIATYDAADYVRAATYTNTTDTTLTVTFNTYSAAGNDFDLAVSDDSTVTAMSGGIDGKLANDKGVTVFTDTLAAGDQNFDLEAPRSGAVSRKTLLLVARSEATDVVITTLGGNAMTITLDAAEEYQELIGYNGSWYSVGGTATVA